MRKMSSIEATKEIARKFFPANADEIIRRYKNNESMLSISVRCDVSTNIVRRILKVEGIYNKGRPYVRTRYDRVFHKTHVRRMDGIDGSPLAEGKTYRQYKEMQRKSDKILKDKFKKYKHELK